MEDADAKVHIPGDELEAKTDPQRRVSDENRAGDTDLWCESLDHRANPRLKLRLRQSSPVVTDIDDEICAVRHLRIGSKRLEHSRAFALI